MKLKACPFCGNEDVDWTHCMESAYIYCGECETQGPPFITEGEFGLGAERKWNKRPVEDALKERIKKLEIALKTIKNLPDHQADERSVIATIALRK